MLSARGERLLMVDADGASLFKDIERLEQEMDKLAPEWVSLLCCEGCVTCGVRGGVRCGVI